MVLPVHFVKVYFHKGVHISVQNNLVIYIFCYYMKLNLGKVHFPVPCFTTLRNEWQSLHTGLIPFMQHKTGREKLDIVEICISWFHHFVQFCSTIDDVSRSYFQMLHPEEAASPHSCTVLSQCSAKPGEKPCDRNTPTL